MKFDRFKFLSAWDWIYILPTVELHWDEQKYLCSNFSIEVHWLGWHGQWRWVEKEEVNNDKRGSNFDFT